MANVAVTNTFVAATTISSSQVNTNFTDLVTWLNNRNSGSDTWGVLKVSGTTGNLADFTSTASTTEVSINNTAADGDPQITFKLNGSQISVIGVDDSDSDFLKFSTTAITTNVAMQIPTVGAQVQFNGGTTALPSISFIGDPDSGFYSLGSNAWSLAAGGVDKLYYDGSGTVVINSTSNVLGTLKISDGSVGSPAFTFASDTDTGIYSVSPNIIGISSAGSLVATFGTNLSVIGTVRGANGSVSLPSFTFESDPDTGTYRIGADALGVAAGGALILSVESTQVSINAANFIIPATKKLLLDGNGSGDTYISESSANIMDLAAGGGISGQFDASAVANNTRFLVYDVTAAALRRVTIGANDSGGAGFRVLRIPN